MSTKPHLLLWRPGCEDNYPKIEAGNDGQVLMVDEASPLGFKWVTALPGEGDFLASGAVPMTGNLNMGTVLGVPAHKITNLLDPTANQDGATKKYVDDNAGGGAGGLGIFGNGADGALVFDGAATILGMVPAANVYTLTRDIYPSSMTVNTDITIIGNDFKIVCKGTLTLSGTAKIHRNGNDAVADVAGAASPNSGSLRYQGPVGATGDIGNGANGNNCSAAYGGSGGNGGDGTATTGGTGGVATIPGPEFGGLQIFNWIPYALISLVNYNSWASNSCGASGAAGGGNGVQKGGGGGGPAACVMICAKIITGTGTIQAKGGDGGDGDILGCGGGGAAGGGLIILVTSEAIPNTITLDVSGGVGGAGTGIGVDGSDGSPGNIYQIIN